MVLHQPWLRPQRPRVWLLAVICGMVFTIHVFRRNADAIHDDFAYVKSVQTARLAHLRQMCSKYNVRNVSSVGRRFIVEPNSKTIFCYIFKVSFSSWFLAYHQIFHSSHSNLTFEAMTNGAKVKTWGPQRGQRVDRLAQDYYAFFAVRNPFDRLLSAYRDRILNCSTGQAEAHVPRIFKHFGIQNKLTRQLLRGVKLSKICPAEPALPTFPQFLSYLTADPRHHLDPHWQPFESSCRPCQIAYRAIIKLETADDDIDFVLGDSGLGDWIRVNRSHVTRGGSSDSREIREKYFSQVPCSLLERVFRFFILDFELFDYSPKEHFQLCKSKSNSVI